MYYLRIIVGKLIPSPRVLGMAGIRVGDFLFLKDIRYSITIVKQDNIDGRGVLFDVRGLAYNEVFYEISFTKTLVFSTSILLKSCLWVDRCLL